MRRILVAISLSALCAGSSGAAVLPFAGSLSLAIELFGNAPLPPVTFSGSGVATASGPGSHLATLALPASPFAPADLVVPVTDPAVFPAHGIVLAAHNGAGTLMAARA